MDLGGQGEKLQLRRTNFSTSGEQYNSPRRYRTGPFEFTKTEPKWFMQNVVGDFKPVRGLISDLAPFSPSI
jgi:hypothetical protein